MTYILTVPTDFRWMVNHVKNDYYKTMIFLLGQKHGYIHRIHKTWIDTCTTHSKLSMIRNNDLNGNLYRCLIMCGLFWLDILIILRRYINCFNGTSVNHDITRIGSTIDFMQHMIKLLTLKYVMQWKSVTCITEHIALYNFSFITILYLL